MTQELADSIKRLRELDAKRTRGDWQLNDFYNKQNHYKPFYINAGEWEALAEVSGHMCTDYVEEARANAEFITAAPEAIQTINQLVELVAKMRIDLNAAVDSYEHKSRYTLEYAQDALTKADALLTKLGEV